MRHTTLEYDVEEYVQAGRIKFLGTSSKGGRTSKGTLRLSPPLPDPRIKKSCLSPVQVHWPLEGTLEGNV